MRRAVVRFGIVLGLLALPLITGAVTLPSVLAYAEAISPCDPEISYVVGYKDANYSGKQVTFCSDANNFYGITWDDGTGNIDDKISSFKFHVVTGGCTTKPRWWSGPNYSGSYITFNDNFVPDLGGWDDQFSAVNACN